ncbi:F-box protein At3g07870 [Helianthus annuus]|nr:F-box protein At3g07870 [Helianthus annuus]
MENELPENIILDVLSRLPVKTIIRFKCVCKKWRDLVSDPYFVHLHHSRSRPCLIFQECIYGDAIVELLEVEHEVDYHSLTLNHVKTLDLSAVRTHTPYWIIQVGSVNGLICLRRKRDATYIFNPVLQEYMIIHQPSDRFLTNGFGVSMAGEYKVIRIRGWRKSKYLENRVTLELEVYTLGKVQWRSLGQTPYNINYTRKLDPGVSVNSHVYWIADAQIYDFDLDTETFVLVPSPPGPQDDQESKQMLGVLKGSLSLFSWCSLGGFEVWVMKESWYKAIAIQENINPVLKTPKWKPLFLIDGSKGTSILILSADKLDRENLVAYCLNTNKFLDLNLPGNCFARMTTYRPSLVKLQNFGSERVHSFYSNDRPLCE